MMVPPSDCTTNACDCKTNAWQGSDGVPAGRLRRVAGAAVDLLVRAELLERVENLCVAHKCHLLPSRVVPRSGSTADVVRFAGINQAASTERGRRAADAAGSRVARTCPL